MGMIGAIGGLIQLSGWSVGLAMMAVGAVAMILVLSWNLVWVNTVLFQITLDDTLA